MEMIKLQYYVAALNPGNELPYTLYKGPLDSATRAMEQAKQLGSARKPRILLFVGDLDDAVLPEVRWKP
jgi:hypothetical protein